MKPREKECAGDRPWQQIVYAVIFKADTAAGKVFDVGLLLAIVLSIGVAMLSSVESLMAAHGKWLRAAGWIFTLLFTLEYGLRLLCLKRRRPYAASFFGLVDFLAVIPAYLSLWVGGESFFVVVRSLRILRVFRILKLGRYEKAGATIWHSLLASREKITVYLVGVMSLMVLIGTLMYLIEGPQAGFTSIPVGVYWAIVTMTTVGYGDIAPQSILGQALASLVMILGYSILAVPTGIVAVDLSRRSNRDESLRRCPACQAEGHDAEAAFCKACGRRL